MKHPDHEPNPPRASEIEVVQSSVRRAVVGVEVELVTSSATTGEDAVPASAYIERLAQQAAQTGSTEEDKLRRYEMRKRALLAKQAVVVADQRDINAAVAVVGWHRDGA
jgi:hypothetical protein